VFMPYVMWRVPPESWQSAIVVTLPAIFAGNAATCESLWWGLRDMLAADSPASEPPVRTVRRREREVATA
jgi:hypothetical protein